MSNEACLDMPPNFSKEDWEKYFNRISEFDEKTLQFYFSQGEKKLESLIKIAESFRDRSLRILAIIIPITLAIFVFIGTNLGEASKKNSCLALAATSLFLLYSARLCLGIINTRKSTVLGCAPTRRISEYWLQIQGEEEQSLQIKHVLLNECKAYQVKIEQRLKENQETGEAFQKITNCAAACPLVCIAVYVLFFII